MIIAETKRLVLKSFEMRDSSEYHTVISDDAIRKYVPYASTYTFRGTKTLVYHYCLGDFINDFYVVIKEKEDDKIVGAIIATKVASTTLEVCYLTAQSCRGKGYMKEALTAFKDYIFEETDFLCMHFTIENENLASNNLIKSIGAKPIKYLTHSTVWSFKKDLLELL